MSLLKYFHSTSIRLPTSSELRVKVRVSVSANTLSFLAKIGCKSILQVTEAFRTGIFAARAEIYTHTNHVQRLRHHKQAHTAPTTAGATGLAPPQLGPTYTYATAVAYNYAYVLKMISRVCRAQNEDIRKALDCPSSRR